MRNYQDNSDVVPVSILRILQRPHTSLAEAVKTYAATQPRRTRALLESTLVLHVRRDIVTHLLTVSWLASICPTRA
ncbi:hypothetical protein Y032_0004g2226 [Ancylostoma ceylanicum]|uniref:Uncharacterized protein n=1 Tax=Ancylostoma ceylanicum TaxID=53326 RepID=A0A016VX65_9BILA|nr:hypothetical protein Y032_0004g2226 [Ancylostoma ceylanicum]